MARPTDRRSEEEIDCPICGFGKVTGTFNSLNQLICTTECPHCGRYWD